MIWRICADCVVVLHFAFILFVALGGLLVLFRPRLAFLHLPAALWGAYIEFAGAICPLTPLENALRAKGGQTAYHTSFIEHYLLPLIYPTALTRDLQIVLGAAVVLTNAVLYALAWRRLVRAKRRAS